MTQLFDQEKVTAIREYNLIQQGKLEGLQQGERQKAIAIAKNFIAMGLDHSVIVQGTGLTLEEIETLANGSDISLLPQ